MDVQTLIGNEVSRTVWKYNKADWKCLRSDIRQLDWDHIFSENSIDNLTVIFVQSILTTAQKYIPQKQAVYTAKSHPWITEPVLEAIRAKCEAHGTDRFRDAAAHAQETITREYRKYQHKLRETMAHFPRGSNK